MNNLYPKLPTEIRIRILTRHLQDGLLSGLSTTVETFLNEKLDEYILRLGYANAHNTGIIIELLTKGKVRVDFKEYTERIELIDPADLLDPLQAMGLLKDAIAERVTHEDVEKDTTTHPTQTFAVQRPKPPG